MAIAPIKGKLHRGLMVDIFGSIGLGLVAGQLYWKYYHVPTLKQIDDFYVNQKALKVDQ
ncbi:hypothetical protein CONCODRAFT_44781 [Conidiobolus coronatus NRRL 28638]|uniref:Cytochrome c oxidase polypeptide VIIA n=1 Tax=Conidiobolus coronatus (strain ATCC 28846 / CBS 209.66 / NRRL 28638) TaxID=796925 RepID=A0A137NQM9_CONC2|nr:hypothetical protein CONCODRAFT_44781 [Conidiobolus coronatus NRRL 28638]|eukprot:KXN65076.1 hypothetical protein CONCODRAFT_44781 [Conidiobolus coronatus NRRL 28638]